MSVKVILLPVPQVVAETTDGKGKQTLATIVTKARIPARPPFETDFRPLYTIVVGEYPTNC
jgi:hypothetical protein